jgi:hypothetical protein
MAMGLKTKTFIFVLLSFLLGLVAGGYIGRTYFAGQGGSHRPTRAAIQKQFAERLHLNASQAVKVDSILEAFRQSFGQVQNGYWQTFHLKRDTLRLSIRVLLAPEQNKLFDDYIKEMDEREAKRRENPDR